MPVHPTPSIAVRGHMTASNDGSVTSSSSVSLMGLEAGQSQQQQGGPCLHHLFETQASKFPNSMALTFDEAPQLGLTYQQLQHRSLLVANALSHLLSTAQDTLVGVHMQRGPGLIVALLGVLRARAAYVPIDPAFPPDRQNFMMQDSGAGVIITDRSRPPPFGGVKIIRVDWETGFLQPPQQRGGGGGPFARSTSDISDDASTPCDGGRGDVTPTTMEIPPPSSCGASSVFPFPPSSSPQTQSDHSLAYVLYTSGSTGLPKGVMLEHRGVVNTIKWFAGELGAGATDVTLGLTTISFDISVLEIFLPLTTGGRLHLISSTSQRDPQALLRQISKQGVTILQATPTTYEMLVAAGFQGGSGLKCLCGGEAFRMNLAPLANKCRSFYNVYGPTETTIWSTAYRLPPSVAPTELVVPIGSPISLTDLLILTPDLRPTEGEGELFIGGVGLARGYLNRPQLTKDRFLLLPPPDGGPLKRYYRTGDRIKRVKGGMLMYLGRLDSQVKLRGYRIELGEIEKALQLHESTRTAVVLLAPDPRNAPTNQRRPSSGSDSSTPVLVAYVRRAPDTPFLPRALLHSHLSSQLPPYMIPTYLVEVSDFPYTPNLKIDRSALPPPRTPMDLFLRHHSSSESPTSSNPSLSHFFSSATAPSSTTTTATTTRTTISPVCMAVMKVVEQVSGARPTPESPLDSIGIDSLGSALFVKRLSAALGGIDVPVTSFFEHRTVRSLANELTRRLRREKPEVLTSLYSRIRADEEVGDEEDLVEEGLEDGGMDELRAAEMAKARADQGIMRMRVRQLEGWRGLLIAWVLIEHYLSQSTRDKLGRRFGANTSIFCLLSGMACAVQFYQAPSFNSLAFLRSRALGLFPIYYLALLLQLPRYIVVRRYGEAYWDYSKTGRWGLGTDYTKATTYLWDLGLYSSGLQTWFKVVHNRGFAALFYASIQWSLYIIFALTAAACRPRLSVGPRPINLYRLWAAMTLFAAPMASFFNDFYFSPLIYLPHFALGVVTGRYLLDHHTSSPSSTVQPLQPQSPSSPPSRMATADMLALFLFWLVVDYHHLGSYNPLDDAISLVVFPALCAWLVILLWKEAGQQQHPQQQKSFLGRWLLPTEALVVLGRLSYAIYLFHEIIGNYYLQLAVKYPGSLLAPPRDTPYNPGIMPGLFEWINDQSLLLRIFAATAVVCWSWLVQYYYQEGLVLHLVGVWSCRPSATCFFFRSRSDTSTISRNTQPSSSASLTTIELVGNDEAKEELVPHSASGDASGDKTYQYFKRGKQDRRDNNNNNNPNSNNSVESRPLLHHHYAVAAV